MTEQFASQMRRRRRGRLGMGRVGFGFPRNSLLPLSTMWEGGEKAKKDMCEWLAVVGKRMSFGICVRWGMEVSLGGGRDGAIEGPIFSVLSSPPPLTQCYLETKFSAAQEESNSLYDSSKLLWLDRETWKVHFHISNLAKLSFLPGATKEGETLSSPLDPWASHSHPSPPQKSPLPRKKSNHCFPTKPQGKRRGKKRGKRRQNSTDPSVYNLLGFPHICGGGEKGNFIATLPVILKSCPFLALAVILL